MTVLCACLVVICYYDYTKGRIPNIFVCGIFIWGMGYMFRSSGEGGVLKYLFAVPVVLLLLYPLFRIGGLGAGDVKLLCVCAGFFPYSKIFIFLFLSLLFSAIISLFVLLKERDWKDRFSYFCEYCAAVAKSGQWKLYYPSSRKGRLRGVCMSGPILCSALLGLGGFY